MLKEYVHKEACRADVPQELIVKVANRGQHGRTYLTKQQRTAIVTEIMTSNLLSKPKVNMKIINDVDLCRMLISAWSIVFTQKTFGVYYTGTSRLVKLNG